MGSLLEHKELLTYLPNGQAVCHDHLLRCCGICCVDFTYDDSDELSNDLEDNDRHHDPNSGSNTSSLVGKDDDRVFVLVGSTARFLPQRDEQVLGPANTSMLPRDDDNPPTPLPPTALTLHSCRDCHLTWLIGNAGFHAASCHPSHPTLHHEYAGTRRSLLVLVDGACASNGLPNAQAGIGVHFGPDSPYNLSQPLHLQAPVTNQKAELEAVIRALDTVRSRVMPARREICSRTLGGKSAVQDAVHLRVVIVTDSSCVVEGMCRHYSTWKIQGGHLRNKNGKVVANSDAFQRVQRAVEALSMIGARVAYYHVRREHNLEADTLAKTAIQRQTLMTSRPSSARSNVPMY